MWRVEWGAVLRFLGGGREGSVAVFVVVAAAVGGGCAGVGVEIGIGAMVN